ncbi:MAG: riboflavin synthase subunit alpha [Gammaproteobacteria bacterium]|nr:riboflavin synthase subunit alpha [Gammaproteobacteria bacterium]
MFTGIIQGQSKILRIEKQPGLWRFAMALSDSLRTDLRQGASVAHNGVCLTVANIDDEAIYFDVMQPTLELTSLSSFNAGDIINVERALKYGDEVGGHVLSGHIQTTATLIERDACALNSRLRFSCDKQWMKYILPKGFIAIDGASLTLGLVGDDWFEVYLIPETRQVTTLDRKVIGSLYNIEIDSQTQAIVDTVERVLAAK